MVWKVNNCGYCEQKKMIKHECMNCGLEVCDNCYCENVDCCINCSDKEIKLQRWS